jgi:trk system potassium uptake protein TrkA
LDERGSDKVKSYLVIGLGRFGRAVALELSKLGNEVLAVDILQDNVQAVADSVTHAVIADARDAAVLKSLSARHFDCAVVAIGNDVGNSALIALTLKELGLPKVVCKAQSETHKKMLQKIGADLVVFPEYETGIKLAQRLTHSGILNFIELSADCGIVEVKTPKVWSGKTIREVDVRNKYRVNIIAIRDDSVGEVNVSHGAEYVLRESDILLILGEDKYISAVCAL